MTTEPTTNEKLFDQVLNYQYERYEPIITRLVAINALLPKLYGEGVKVPQHWLDGLLEEIIKLDNKK